MHSLDALQQLDRDQQHCLEIEFTLAGLEKILERGPQQVHDNHVVVLAVGGLVSADVVEERHAP